MPRVIESLSFIGQFIRKPGQIGAILPSSRFLASALTRPLSRHRGPTDILELGAGTGSVTRRIAGLLGRNDRLDICEANEQLAEHLQRDFLDEGALQAPFAQGRVRLLAQQIQDVPDLGHYDFIISGLPFTAFEIRDVIRIVELIKRHAKPGCVFSYFEYIAIRTVLAGTHPGAKGRKFRKLSTYLSRQIAEHEVRRDAVFCNVPPAYARHLCFRPCVPSA